MQRPTPLLLVTLAAVLAVFPETANAYIDPGTGSLLVQSLLATIAAGLVFGRTAWHRIKAFFRGRRDPPRDSD
jgi:hypothetical protein